MELENDPVMAPWNSLGGIDVALVIALDVSSSVTGDEFELMREGLARALDTDEVAQAVTSGPNGVIAISVMQWSGFQEQEVKTDWLRVANREDLARVASLVRNSDRWYYGGATDIGGSIVFCQKMLFRGPADATRLIIDIAGDGSNNVNHSPRIDSDIAAAAGVTINGLAITSKDDNLVAYYRDTVIGGPAAFVEKTPDYAGFFSAMRRKLVREITALYS